MVDPVLFLLFAVFTSSQIQLVFNICRHTQNFEGQWGRFFLRRMSCENQTKRECPHVLEVHFWGYKRLTRQFLWGFSGNLHSPKDFVFDFFLDRGFLPNHDQGGGSSPQHNDAASLCSRCGGDPNKILKGNHVVKCDVKTPIQKNPPTKNLWKPPGSWFVPWWRKPLYDHLSENALRSHRTNQYHPLAHEALTGRGVWTIIFTNSIELLVGG